MTGNVSVASALECGQPNSVVVQVWAAWLAQATVVTVADEAGRDAGGIVAGSFAPSQRKRARWLPTRPAAFTLREESAAA